MRRRTRESMSMGENELLVLRYLLRAAGQNRQVSPTELTRYLGVSTASTTAIVDRLEKSGHVVRQPHRPIGGASSSSPRQRATPRCGRRSGRCTRA